MKLAGLSRASVAISLAASLASCAGPAAPLASLTTPVPLEDGQPHLYWADPTLDWTISQLDPLGSTATIGGPTSMAPG